MSGYQLKTVGIRRVLSKEQQWKIDYSIIVDAWFHRIPRGTRFCGETLRMAAKHNGLSDPHHHNAWGGMANSFLSGVRAYIRREGTLPAQDPKAHGRTYPAYVKT